MRWIKGGTLALMVAASLGVYALRADDEKGKSVEDLPRRGMLGVAIAPATPESRAEAKVEGEIGVLVRDTIPGTPARDAGLKAGDLLVKLDGVEIASVPNFLERVGKLRAGKEASLELVRDGERRNTTLVYRERPRETSDTYDATYGMVTSGPTKLRTIVTKPKTPPKSGSTYPAVFLIQGIGCASTERVPFGPGMFDQLIDALTAEGYVTYRVEKPGCGDSEGAPCNDVDFKDELAGYRQGLAALRAVPFVDRERIVLFGHSMGGVMAPLLAAETSVRGVIVYGTLSKTWYEYMLENDRRQVVLNGGGEKDVDARARLSVPFWSALVHGGLTPAEVAEKYPELRVIANDLSPDGKHVFDRSAAFFRQLAQTNLAEAWSKTDAHVLALWGKADYVSAESDHALIARIVNNRNAGRGTFKALDGIDHGFRRADSFAESAQGGSEPFNPILLDTIRDWLRGLEAPASR